MRIHPAVRRSHNVNVEKNGIPRIDWSILLVIFTARSPWLEHETRMTAEGNAESGVRLSHLRTNASVPPKP